MSDVSNTATIAAQVATRSEATRLDEHRAALTSLRELGLPLEPPDPVLVIDARIRALVEIYDREWGEFDIEAAVAFAASSAALRDARAVSARVYPG